MVGADLFKRGMRRLAAGVSVITTEHDGDRYGLVATSVTSVSADPPSILICVNRTATSHDPIAKAAVFCVNILGEGDDGIAKRFAMPHYRDIRFSHRQWRALTTGAPALVGCLASLDCRIVKAVPVATHTIFVAEVVAAELWHKDIVPLIYVDGQFKLANTLLAEPMPAFDPGWG
jgi:flavin reductase